jgi:uncharacterized protein YgbK (DUF1537 family)
MTRLLVIADDLTGAAEIGGLAAAHGLSARIALRRPPADADDDADVLILDTNTRHLAPPEAAAALADVARHIPAGRFPQTYKKIDSALRGPVAAELHSLLRTSRWRRAVLIAQNPSRGRTIVDGQYLIDGAPLHRTFMAHDPEHPADTADVRERVGRYGDVPVSLVAPQDALPERGIILCEAADLATVGRRAGELDPLSLPVGGADFFRAVLRSQSRHAVARAQPPPRHSGLTLVVCGSACERSRSEVATQAARGSVVMDFPLALCDADPSGSERARWAGEVAGRLRHAGSAWIAVRSEVAHGWAPRLRAAMADAVVRICEREPTIGRLLIEGGATAAAIADRAGWTTLVVTGELAGGVVSVRPDGAAWRSTNVVLKPGSYSWPTGTVPTS